MPRLEQVALALLLGAVASTARAADEAPFRYSAPITLQQSGAFVQMALPVGAYAHSAQPGLRDLRVVDARGERVPFALVAPRQSERQLQQRHAATLYPLPPKPASGGTWTSPVEVQVQGYKGKGCLEAMKIFQQIVGEMKSQTFTHEYYAPEEDVRINIERRH